MGRINASPQGVQVEGLNELNRALRGLGGSEMQKELKEAGLEVAKDVTAAARSKAMSLGGVAAKAAPSLKAAGRNTGAGVSMGGSRFPFAGGAEFGSLQYAQFKPWRGSDSGAGYFLYPTIRDKSETIASTYQDAVDELVRKYGL